MKDLNQVQNALEEKAKNEVRQIVENFIKEVDQMNDKYNGMRLFYLGSNKEIFCDIDDFQKIITNALIERHNEYIVKYKTRELLNKLELI
jgi:neutral trehalase